MFYYHSFPFNAVADANQAECTSCECDNTSAIIGGVVAVAFMITASLTVLVIVILLLRSRSGNYSAKTRQEHTLLHCYDTCHWILYRATVVTTNQSVELSNFSEAIYE